MRPASRHGHPPPVLPGRLAGRRQLPRLRGGDPGRAGPGAIVLPPAECRDGGDQRERAGAPGPGAGGRIAGLRDERQPLHAQRRGGALARPARSRAVAISGARTTAGRPLPPGDRRQPGRLYPVHALPARLPRSAGQRRHRLRVSRRRIVDRVRSRRPARPEHLRGLRRMRAGLPDRRADARASGRGQPFATGRPTRAVSASRAAMVSTTCTTASA